MASYGYISDYMSSIDDDYASRKGTKPAFTMLNYRYPDGILE